MGLVRQQNIKVIDIPFKGDAPLLMSLLNKDVDVVSGGFLPYTNRDDVRVIMTCGENRMEAAPTVPTYKETFGIEPVVGLPTSVVFVPRGTPDIIIKRLHDSFRKAMEDKRFKDSMFKGGLPIAYKGTKEIQQFAIEERNRVLQSMKEESMIK
jgi:tripartite-type tricarboxylate transporter receptor subunit TctC